jgi:hypothetical protein
MKLVDGVKQRIDNYRNATPFERRRQIGAGISAIAVWGGIGTALWGLGSAVNAEQADRGVCEMNTKFDEYDRSELFAHSLAHQAGAVGATFEVEGGSLTAEVAPICSAENNNGTRDIVLMTGGLVVAFSGQLTSEYFQARAAASPPGAAPQ